MTKLFVEYTEMGKRIALTQGGKLTQIIVDKKDTSLVGNVIVGRLCTIMPGQFAFIDIGPGKNAFANLKQANTLKAGQPVLVQVLKDGAGSKGPYVTTDISLKGWYVIIHKSPPGEVGVSHKIGSEKESRRLKTLVRNLLPKGYGAIVRTNAQHATPEAIGTEIEELCKKYEYITTRAQFALPPAKLYPDANISSLLSDMVIDKLEEVHIAGSPQEFDQARECILEFAPSLEGCIVHHEGDKPMFKAHGISPQITKSLDTTVALPCGGFITIEETEACVVIDVNTGNNTKSNSYRDTILNTNLEAAKAIVDQLILRNLSGIIIIDFIDMAKQEDKAKLMETFGQELTRDRTNPEVVGMSKLGIVQMARPKRRLSLRQYLEVNCPSCGGKGRVRG